MSRLLTFGNLFTTQGETELHGYLPTPFDSAAQ
jgi:hypothetical protein